MELKEDYWTGDLSNVLESLNRSIAQYIRNNSKVKVGITCNPQRRANEHSKFDWTSMVIKYKTTSVNYINQIEKILIENHWDYLANEVAGGGGPNGNPPYYLYVLLK